MKLTALGNLYFAERGQVFKAGDVMEVPAGIGSHWIKTGAAKLFVDVPEKETAVVNKKRKRETREAK